MGKGPGKLILTLTLKPPALCIIVLTRIAGAGFPRLHKHPPFPRGGICSKHDQAPSYPPSTPWLPSPLSSRPWGSPSISPLLWAESAAACHVSPAPFGSAGSSRGAAKQPPNFTSTLVFAATGSGLGGREGGEGGKCHGQQAAWEFVWMG